MLDPIAGKVLTGDGVPTGGVLGVLTALVVFVGVVVVLVGVQTVLRSVLPEPAVLPATVVAVAVVAVAGLYAVVEINDRRSY